jgi:ammonium transporter, Amt family
VGIFAAGFPTGVDSVPSSLLGQLVGMATFFPLGFLPGYFASMLLKKLNLLRVPPEVELHGLDYAEFDTDFYPEFGRNEEVIVMEDGREVPSGEVLREAYRTLVRQ